MKKHLIYFVNIFKMRKTQSIEVVGIGNFNIYPITIKEAEYNKINEQGNILNKKVMVAGTQAKYVYVDNAGTEYPSEKVFTDFNGVKLQQIKRTEQVKKFELVDKLDIYGLTEYNISFLDTDLTTLSIFDEKVKDKAICFKLKKSTIGFNFYRAYILKLNGVLVMITGKGNLINAISDFKSMIANKKENKNSEIVIQKVEVSADEIENLINI